MKPLRVALVHRNNPRCMDRMYGEFSYTVPEFVVRHFPVEPHRAIQKATLAKDHDIIIVEDFRVHGLLTELASIPVCYRVVDSTLSEAHYRWRLGRAKELADLILVDQDGLERFEGVGVPVRRFGYCVNDRLFKDHALPKDIDVSFFCIFKGAPERERMHRWLAEFCQGWGYSYQGGIREALDYAQGFNRSKISVNLSRVPANRPHRIYDAMASRTCLLTSKPPEVSMDRRDEGIHYQTYDRDDWATLGARIDWLLVDERWERTAQAGYEQVQRCHTWAIRAKELHATLLEVFPCLV